MFKKLTKITYLVLHLRLNKIEFHGMKQLGRGLVNLKKLNKFELDIPHNNIGDDGLKLLKTILLKL